MDEQDTGIPTANINVKVVNHDGTEFPVMEDDDGDFMGFPVGVLRDIPREVVLSYIQRRLRVSTFFAQTMMMWMERWEAVSQGKPPKGDWQTRALQAEVKVEDLQQDLLSHVQQEHPHEYKELTTAGRALEMERGFNDRLFKFLDEMGIESVQLRDGTTVPMEPLGGFGRLGFKLCLVGHMNKDAEKCVNCGNLLVCGVCSECGLGVSDEPLNKDD